MSSAANSIDKQLLNRALESARDTKAILVERNARSQAPAVFATLYGTSPSIVVADESTFAVAGRDVIDAMRSAAQPCLEPLILPSAGLYAEYSVLESLLNRLSLEDAVPIAVGSGTINDLTKLAAHKLSRPYLSIATAASMDGFTAFGASITKDGSKQTFDCPAPVAVIADLDVIVDAPEGMNASGYADLIAKCPAGADWLLADALGEEPMHTQAWEAVQKRLPKWIENPAGVQDRDMETLERLTIALLMTGFAMQMTCTSRPASGAEHQFSHLWDMQHHTFHGETPSHGFKVGIGSVASTKLYERLFDSDLESLDVATAVSAWPDIAANDREIEESFEIEELAAKAKKESRVKHLGSEDLRKQLHLLKRIWPELREQLAQHLIPAHQLQEMLQLAGCPYESSQIGISASRLRRSYLQAYHIRRRYTVLDCARRCSHLESSLKEMIP